jgi:hypothetical protein
MQDSDSGAAQRVFLQTTSLHRIDEFIGAHRNLIALGITGIGLLLRIHAASGTFLNPDEALHVSVADQNSLGDAYAASLTLAHPPLLIILLYFWRHIGASEFLLRLPSVIMGSLFCWIFFKWVKVILGDIAATTALMFVAFLPPMVALSAEVRQYSLLLFFMAAAAYLLETSIATKSLPRMALAFVCLWLAMLSHYSGFLFAAVFCLYAAMRVFSVKVPLRIRGTWFSSELGTAALALFLYRTQISSLKGSDLAGEAARSWLRRSYFHAADDNLLAFVFGRSFAVFQFIFGQQVIGDLAGLQFVGGVVLLLRSRSGTTANRWSWQLASFLVLPFILNCGLAVAGGFPYGGTRHSIFLAMFALAGCSVCLAQAAHERFGLGIFLANIIIGVCYLFGFHHQPYMARSDQSRSQMNNAVNFIRQQIPGSNPIFVDYQASLLLGHYLCETKLERQATSDFESFDCAGHHVISLADVPRFWSFTPETFSIAWDELLSARQLKPGDNVWVIQAGWGASIAPDLARLRADLIPEQIQSFGRNITFFRLSSKTSSHAPASS